MPCVLPDLVDASDERPVALPVVGDIAAGSYLTMSIRPGYRAHHDRRSVARRFRCCRSAGMDRSHRCGADPASARGRARRCRGEDVEAGTTVLKAGSRLNARQIGLLAALGHDRVLAGRDLGSWCCRPDRARRARCCSGSGADHRFQQLPAGRCCARGRCSGVPRGPGARRSAHPDGRDRGPVHPGGPHRHQRRCIRRDVRRGPGSRPSSGPFASRRSRCSPECQGFGVIGPDETPIFTLPGNPVSCYVSFEIFVRPVLRKLAGQDPVEAADRQGDVCVEVLVAGRKAAVRPSEVGATRQRHLCRGTARRRCQLAPDGRPGRCECADRRARANEDGPCGHEGRRPGPGATQHVTSRDLTHVDERRCARWSTCREGRIGAHGTCHQAGPWCLTTITLLRGDGVPKGDVLAVARIAESKRQKTRIWCRLSRCLRAVKVELSVADDAVDIIATVRTTDRTGVEMEALTAVSVAALTVVRTW